MRRWQSLSTAALLVSGIGFSLSPAHADKGQSSTPTITEYAAAGTTGLSQGIDVDHAGNVWYAETAAGALVWQHPDGTTQRFPLPAGGQPNTVKIGDGSIWFSDSGKAAIGRLDLRSGSITEFPIPSGTPPTFIEIGQHNTIWFAELHQNADFITLATGVGRLSLNGNGYGATGSVTEWLLPVASLQHPDDNIEEINLDQAGRLWFVERNFDNGSITNQVSRLDPQTGIVQAYTLPTLTGNPAGLVIGKHNTVWVSEYFANKLALLNPDLAAYTQYTLAPTSNGAVPTSGTPATVVPQPNPGTTTPVPPVGNIVTPTNTVRGWTEWQIPTASDNPEDLRLDSKGNLWFEEDNGKLGVLNPTTNAVVEYNIPTNTNGYYNISLQSNNKIWYIGSGLFQSFVPVPTTPKIGVLQTGSPDDNQGDN